MQLSRILTATYSTDVHKDTQSWVAKTVVPHYYLELQYLLLLLVPIIVYGLIIELSQLMVVLNVRPVIRKAVLTRTLKLELHC